MNFHRAFTLLEVLIVLVIISIMAGISIPYLKNFITSTQEEAIRTELIQAIRYAQQEAELRHAEIMYLLENTKQIIFINEYQDGIVHEPSQILYEHKLNLHHGKLSMRSYPFYHKYIRFDPVRVNQNDNATFWYCSQNSENPSWAISVNKSGRSRIMLPDNNGEIFDANHRKLACE